MDINNPDMRCRYAARQDTLELLTGQEKGDGSNKFSGRHDVHSSPAAAC